MQLKDLVSSLFFSFSQIKWKMKIPILKLKKRHFFKRKHKEKLAGIGKYNYKD